MTWLGRLLHKSPAESELDKELRFHLEQQIADGVAKGLSPRHPLGNTSRQSLPRFSLRLPQSPQRSPLRLGLHLPSWRQSKTPHLRRLRHLWVGIRNAAGILSSNVARIALFALASCTR